MTTEPQQDQLHPGGPMSIEEYLQLDKNTSDARYEYLDGTARLMAGGTIEHSKTGRNVANTIDMYLQSKPRAVFGSSVQTLLRTQPGGWESYVYPDVTVSCDVADRRRGNTLIRSPRMVVEVLSPSTETLDRGKKLEAYKACPTIQEIVLIDQFMQAVEVYRRAEEDSATWRYLFYGPDSTVELTSVDIHITLNEIYKGINFDEPLMGE